MNEVTILAEFTTGTTISDKAAAKTDCVKLLQEQLSKHHIAGEDGVFQIKILEVCSESLRSKKQTDNIMRWLYALIFSYLTVGAVDGSAVFIAAKMRLASQVNPIGKNALDWSWPMAIAEALAWPIFDTLQGWKINMGLWDLFIPYIVGSGTIFILVFWCMNRYLKNNEN